MKFKNILICFISVGLLSCLGLQKQSTYFGNFHEKKYNFQESFSHNTWEDYYYRLPFSSKFGGINPTRHYQWLRKPQNLKIAFNSIKAIGLDKFISKAQYNEKSNNSKDWKNMSLSDIVEKLLKTDTIAVKEDYFSKFWARRKKEGNLTVTYKVLKEVSTFYNAGKDLTQNDIINDTLKNLLEFDIKLIKSDSSQYYLTALDYFNYLKTIGMDYSGFKLIFHNNRIQLSKHQKDSLIKTVNCDTISETDWRKLNDNHDGWISGFEFNYNDPNKYYGP